MTIKNKRVFKKIAKEVAAKCISSIDGFAFEDSIEEGLIDEEEVQFILDECKLIASKMSDKNLNSTRDIIRHYFEYHL